MDKQAIIKEIHGSNYLLTKACEAVPADKFDWAPGEAGTPLRGILSHCAAFPHWVISAVRSRGLPEGHQEPEVGSLAAGLEQLQANSAELIAFIEALPESEAGVTVNFPWGEATVAEALGYHSWNNTYHLGQVNYLQLMLGDMEFHM